MPRLKGQYGKACPPEQTAERCQKYLDNITGSCSIWACAIHCGISEPTLRVRANDYPEIKEILEKIKDKRKEFIDQGAIVGTLNTAYAIFAMKNLGLKDSQDLNIGGQHGNPVESTIDLSPDKIVAIRELLMRGKDSDSIES